MPQNLELKIRVDDLNEIEDFVKQLGADYKGILSQRDVYFRWKKGLLKLRIENGTSQLIKYSRNESGGDRFSDYRILSVEGSSPEEYFSDILEFETAVEKQRKLYIYNNTRIHLDEVNGLGSFMELETIVVKDEADALERFNKIVEFLNIDIEKQIRKSYRDMLIEKGEQD